MSIRPKHQFCNPHPEGIIFFQGKIMADQRTGKKKKNRVDRGTAQQDEGDEEMSGLQPPAQFAQVVQQQPGSGVGGFSAQPPPPVLPGPAPRTDRKRGQSVETVGLQPDSQVSGKRQRRDNSVNRVESFDFLGAGRLARELAGTRAADCVLELANLYQDRANNVDVTEDVNNKLDELRDLIIEAEDVDLDQLHVFMDEFYKPMEAWNAENATELVAEEPARQSFDSLREHCIAIINRYTEMLAPIPNGRDRFPPEVPDNVIYNSMEYVCDQLKLGFAPMHGQGLWPDIAQMRRLILTYEAEKAAVRARDPEPSTMNEIKKNLKKEADLRKSVDAARSSAALYDIRVQETREMAERLRAIFFENRQTLGEPPAKGEEAYDSGDFRMAVIHYQAAIETRTAAKAVTDTPIKQAAFHNLQKRVETARLQTLAGSVSGSQVEAVKALAVQAGIVYGDAEAVDAGDPASDPNGYVVRMAEVIKRRMDAFDARAKASPGVKPAAMNNLRKRVAKRLAGIKEDEQDLAKAKETETELRNLLLRVGVPSERVVQLENPARVGDSIDNFSRELRSVLDRDVGDRVVVDKSVKKLVQDVEKYMTDRQLTAISDQGTQAKILKLEELSRALSAATGVQPVGVAAGTTLAARLEQTVAIVRNQLQAAPAVPVQKAKDVDISQVTKKIESYLKSRNAVFADAMSAVARLNQMVAESKLGELVQGAPATAPERLAWYRREFLVALEGAIERLENNPFNVAKIVKKLDAHRDAIVKTQADMPRYISELTKILADAKKLNGSEDVPLRPQGVTDLLWIETLRDAINTEVRGSPVVAALGGGADARARIAAVTVSKAGLSDLKKKVSEYAKFRKDMDRASQNERDKRTEKRDEARRIVEQVENVLLGSGYPEIAALDLGGSDVAGGENIVEYAKRLLKHASDAIAASLEQARRQRLAEFGGKGPDEVLSGAQEKLRKLKKAVSEWTSMAKDFRKNQEKLADAKVQFKELLDEVNIGGPGPAPVLVQVPVPAPAPAPVPYQPGGAGSAMQDGDILTGGIFGVDQAAIEQMGPKELLDEISKAIRIVESNSKGDDSDYKEVERRIKKLDTKLSLFTKKLPSAETTALYASYMAKVAGLSPAAVLEKFNADASTYFGQNGVIKPAVLKAVVGDHEYGRLEAMAQQRSPLAFFEMLLTFTESLADWEKRYNKDGKDSLRAIQRFQDETNEARLELEQAYDGAPENVRDKLNESAANNQRAARLYTRDGQDVWLDEFGRPFSVGAEVVYVVRDVEVTDINTGATGSQRFAITVKDFETVARKLKDTKIPKVANLSTLVGQIETNLDKVEQFEKDQEESETLLEANREMLQRAVALIKKHGGNGVTVVRGDRDEDDAPAGAPGAAASGAQPDSDADSEIMSGDILTGANIQWFDNQDREINATLLKAIKEKLAAINARLRGRKKESPDEMDKLLDKIDSELEKAETALDKAGEAVRGVDAERVRSIWIGQVMDDALFFVLSNYELRTRDRSAISYEEWLQQLAEASEGREARARGVAMGAWLQDKIHQGVAGSGGDAQMREHQVLASNRIVYNEQTIGLIQAALTAISARAAEAERVAHSSERSIEAARVTASSVNEEARKTERLLASYISDSRQLHNHAARIREQATGVAALVDDHIGVLANPAARDMASRESVRESARIAGEIARMTVDYDDIIKNAGGDSARRDYIDALTMATTDLKDQVAGMETYVRTLLKGMEEIQNATQKQLAEVSILDSRTSIYLNGGDGVRDQIRDTENLVAVANGLYRKLQLNTEAAVRVTKDLYPHADKSGPRAALVYVPAESPIVSAVHAGFYPALKDAGEVMAVLKFLPSAAPKGWAANWNPDYRFTTTRAAVVELVAYLTRYEYPVEKIRDDLVSAMVKVLAPKELDQADTHFTWYERKNRQEPLSNWDTLRRNRLTDLFDDLGKIYSDAATSIRTLNDRLRVQSAQVDALSSKANETDGVFVQIGKTRDEIGRKATKINADRVEVARRVTTTAERVSSLVPHSSGPVEGLIYLNGRGFFPKIDSKEDLMRAARHLGHVDVADAAERFEPLDAGSLVPFLDACVAHHILYPKIVDAMATALAPDRIDAPNVSTWYNTLNEELVNWTDPRRQRIEEVIAGLRKAMQTASDRIERCLGRIRDQHDAVSLLSKGAGESSGLADEVVRKKRQIPEKVTEADETHARLRDALVRSLVQTGSFGPHSQQPGAQLMTIRTNANEYTEIDGIYPLITDLNDLVVVAGLVGIGQARFQAPGFADRWARDRAAVLNEVWRWFRERNVTKAEILGHFAQLLCPLDFASEERLYANYYDSRLGDPKLTNWAPDARARLEKVIRGVSEVVKAADTSVNTCAKALETQSGLVANLYGESTTNIGNSQRVTEKLARLQADINAADILYGTLRDNITDLIVSTRSLSPFANESSARLVYVVSPQGTGLYPLLSSEDDYNAAAAAAGIAGYARAEAVNESDPVFFVNDFLEQAVGAGVAADGVISAFVGLFVPQQIGQDLAEHYNISTGTFENWPNETRVAVTALVRDLGNVVNDASNKIGVASAALIKTRESVLELAKNIPVSEIAEAIKDNEKRNAYKEALVRGATALQNRYDEFVRVFMASWDTVFNPLNSPNPGRAYERVDEQTGAPTPRVTLVNGNTIVPTANVTLYSPGSAEWIDSNTALERLMSNIKAYVETAYQIVNVARERIRGGRDVYAAYVKSAEELTSLTSRILETASRYSDDPNLALRQRLTDSKLAINVLADLLTRLRGERDAWADAAVALEQVTRKAFRTNENYFNNLDRMREMVDAVTNLCDQVAASDSPIKDLVAVSRVRIGQYFDQLIQSPRIAVAPADNFGAQLVAIRRAYRPDAALPDEQSAFALWLGGIRGERAVPFLMESMRASNPEWMRTYQSVAEKLDTVFRDDGVGVKETVQQFLRTDVDIGLLSSNEKRNKAIAQFADMQRVVTAERLEMQDRMARLEERMTQQAEATRRMSDAHTAWEQTARAFGAHIAGFAPLELQTKIRELAEQAFGEERRARRPLTRSFERVAGVVREEGSQDRVARINNLIRAVSTGAQDALRQYAPKVAVLYPELEGLVTDEQLKWANAAEQARKNIVDALAQAYVMRLVNAGDLSAVSVDRAREFERTITNAWTQASQAVTAAVANADSSYTRQIAGGTERLNKLAELVVASDRTVKQKSYQIVLDAYEIVQLLRPVLRIIDDKDSVEPAFRRLAETVRREYGDYLAGFADHKRDWFDKTRAGLDAAVEMYNQNQQAAALVRGEEVRHPLAYLEQFCAIVAGLMAAETKDLLQLSRTSSGLAKEAKVDAFTEVLSKAARDNAGPAPAAGRPAADAVVGEAASDFGDKAAAVSLRVDERLAQFRWAATQAELQTNIKWARYAMEHPGLHANYLGYFMTELGFAAIMRAYQYIQSVPAIKGVWLVHVCTSDHTRMLFASRVACNALEALYKFPSRNPAPADAKARVLHEMQINEDRWARLRARVSSVADNDQMKDLHEGRNPILSVRYV